MILQEDIFDCDFLGNRQAPSYNYLEIQTTVLPVPIWEAGENEYLYLFPYSTERDL